MKIIRKPNTDDILEAVKNNDNYCPCKIVKNTETKCMCKEFIGKIKREELGECSCGLYEIVEID
jgi:hypothetical protein